MANPQVENGYTRVSNELLVAMIRRITNSTWLRILLYIARITYGYRQKYTLSHYSSFATVVGLKEKTIKSAFLDMAEKNIIMYEIRSEKSFLVSINKNYEKWSIEK